MKTSDFEQELKKIDPRLEIVVNPNRPGLSNVKLSGQDVCPVPSDDIREESDPNYTYTFPNGMIARHKSMAEVRDMVKTHLRVLSEDPQTYLDK